MEDLYFPFFQLMFGTVIRKFPTSMIYSIISRTDPNDVPRNAGWEAMLQTECDWGIYSNMGGEERRGEKIKLKEEWEDKKYRKARKKREERERKCRERESEK
jgi:hypothetical protein